MGIIYVIDGISKIEKQIDLASIADDGFGNMINVPRTPFHVMTEEEIDDDWKRRGGRKGWYRLPSKFQIANGSYAFVVNDWLFGWGTANGH